MTREEAPRWYTPGGFAPDEAARNEDSGWTNHITGAAHLWITNDGPTYTGARAAAEAGVPALEAYARAHPELMQRLSDECDRGETVQDINWAEIREALLEE